MRTRCLPAIWQQRNLLLIDKGHAQDVRDYIRQNLSNDGNVYVIGGSTAVPNEWMAGISFERLGGSNRYETNLMILGEAGVDKKSEIMVCTGMNFADSLSVSATGNPILLVGSSLSDSQKEYLGTFQGYSY